MFGIKYNFRKNHRWFVWVFFFLVPHLFHFTLLIIIEEKKSRRTVSSRNLGTSFWMKSQKKLCFLLKCSLAFTACKAAMGFVWEDVCSEVGHSKADLLVVWKNTQIFSFFGHCSKRSLLSYPNVSPLSKRDFHIYSEALT